MPAKGPRRLSGAWYVDLAVVAEGKSCPICEVLGVASYIFYPEIRAYCGARRAKSAVAGDSLGIAAGEAQIRAAIDCGVPLNSLLIIEWSISN